MTSDPNPAAPPGPILNSQEKLQVLHGLALTALHDLTINEMADLALDETMNLVAPDLAFLFEAIGEELVLQGVRPPGLASPGKTEIGKGLCGLAAKNRQPLYSMDSHNDARCTLKEYQADELHSFAALPLTVDERLIGVLGLATTRERDFAKEGELLTAMADTIARTIMKARSCHELRERALDLEGRMADCTAELAIRGNELERLNRIFVDREFRIKELRERVKALEGG